VVVLSLRSYRLKVPSILVILKLFVWSIQATRLSIYFTLEANNPAIMKSNHRLYRITGKELCVIACHY
jgi:hypothetical protein